MLPAASPKSTSPRCRFDHSARHTRSSFNGRPQKDDEASPADSLLLALNGKSLVAQRLSVAGVTSAVTVAQGKVDPFAPGIPIDGRFTLD